MMNKLESRLEDLGGQGDIKTLAKVND